MKFKIAVLMVFGVMLFASGCNEKSPVSTEFSDAPALEADQWDNDSDWDLLKGRHHSEKLKVMTWNVYVGTDVDKILAAQTPEEIPALVAEAFQTLLATNFPERADFMAKSIARMRPHLIGLQEISTIRIQSPGDAVIGGTIPAENVLFDYLGILLAALENHGQHYTVAGIIQDTDVEVPMLTGVDPLTFDDVRLTDFDVVLARDDVPISNVVQANYNTVLPAPTFPGLNIIRGYVAVDAKIHHRVYRFVNTHLESAFDPVQLGQAQELMAALVSETKPVILVGDFNSDAVQEEATYQFIESNGFIDTWPLVRRADPRNPLGLTSPHDADLRNADVNFSERIDLIFFRPGAANSPVEGLRVKARILGDNFRERTVSGMWPSDHAGLVEKLRVRFDNDTANN